VNNIDDFERFIDNINKDISYNCFYDSPISSDIINEWKQRMLYEQMLDIWGQANAVIELYKSNYGNSDIENALSNFSRLCCIIYGNDLIKHSIKWELKIAEYELYDFFNDNTFINNETTVMRWFNEWCYEINFEAYTLSD
jgi:hypothetical protein